MSTRDNKWFCKICNGKLEDYRNNLCSECKEKMLNEKWLCRCGCGTIINRWNLSHKGNIRERKYIDDHNCARCVKSDNYKCPCCIRTFSDLKSFYRHIDKNRCINKDKMNEFKNNWNKLCHCGCGVKIKPGRLGLPGHMQDDPWNKGLTKKDDERLVEYSKRRMDEIQRDPYKSGQWMAGSSIELKVKSYLERLGIKFIHQFNFFYKFVADFAIPDKKLIIECDGDYWHSLPNIEQKDEYINKSVKDAGWKIIRFSETNIKENFYNIKEEILDAVSL